MDINYSLGSMNHVLVTTRETHTLYIATDKTPFFQPKTTDSFFLFLRKRVVDTHEALLTNTYNAHVYFRKEVKK